MIRRVIPFLLLASPLAAATYAVGPEQALTSIGAVPWATLQPGDLVLIHHRSTPYREKWVINCSGTTSKPIIVRGVPAADGTRPIISGDGAVTAPGLDFWNDARGLLKIGGANTPDHSGPPSHIVIEGLVLQDAYQDHDFTDDHGNAVDYTRNAAGLYIETGAHITIRSCELTGNGNGIFCAGETREVLIEDCYIHGNGVVGSLYEHNTYTEATGLIYRGNRFGSLRSGALGNNLKDRSSGLQVIANWIAGGNRCLDLVDSDHATRLADPRYRETTVVGNVLLKRDGGNSQVIHYGGDSGDTEVYRKGTLRLYHNTIYSTRSTNTTLIRLSSSDEYCDARCNIIHVTEGSGALALLDDTGTLDLRGNWLTNGWTLSHSSGASGTVHEPVANVTGDDPQWQAPASEDFTPSLGSLNRDSAVAIPDFPPDRQYQPLTGSHRRYDDGAPDRGAIERHNALQRRLHITIDRPDVAPAIERPAGAATHSGCDDQWHIRDLFNDETCIVTWYQIASG